MIDDPTANHVGGGVAGVTSHTFHQDGRCVYADDRVCISLIHETGTVPDRRIIRYSLAG